MSEERISVLIGVLSSPRGMERERARIQIVELGPPAVDPLLEALRCSREKHTVWELTKALSDIGSPEAAPGLVSSLSHKESDIRWIAAQGLIRLGRVGLRQVLSALESDEGVSRFREGAHHVLHDLASDFPEVVHLVLSSLKSPAADDTVPLAAREALRKLC